MLYFESVRGCQGPWGEKMMVNDFGSVPVALGDLRGIILALGNETIALYSWRAPGT